MQNTNTVAQQPALTEILDLLHNHNMQEHLQAVANHAVSFGGDAWGSAESNSFYFVVQLQKSLGELRQQMPGE